MKYLKILQYIFIAVGVLSVATLLFMSEDAAVNLMMTWCYIVMGLAIAAVIIFPLFNLASNPKGALRSLVGLAVVVVVALVCYFLANPEPVLASNQTDWFSNPVENKLSDMGLYLTYIAMAGAILVAIGGQIRNAFK